MRWYCKRSARSRSQARSSSSNASRSSSSRYWGSSCMGASQGHDRHHQIAVAVAAWMETTLLTEAEQSQEGSAAERRPQTFCHAIDARLHGEHATCAVHDERARDLALRVALFQRAA